MVVPRKYRMTVESQPCGICHQQPFKYICPRCNLRYCSLTCYKDKSHLRCTESFYRSAIMGELQSMPTAGAEDRQKMMRILHRFENESSAPMHDPTQNQLQSQNTTTKTRKTALTVQERQEILSRASSGASEGVAPRIRHDSSPSLIKEEKVKDETKTTDDRRISSDADNALGEETLHDNGNDDDDEDSGDDEEDEAYLDFVSRFANVDLDNESFESIWSRLSPAEQKGFREMFMIRDMPPQAQSLYHREEETNVADDGMVVNEAEEEEEIFKLMQATSKELEDALRTDDPLLADLDADDLRALRETEIAELVPVWRPWWEMEAEEHRQLRRVEETAPSQAQGDLSAANVLLEQQKATARSALGQDKEQQQRLVLDEEALLRPYTRRPLVQELSSSTEGSPSDNGSQVAVSSAPPQPPTMTKPPHPSLIYHLTALLFSYAATSRMLNGDLTEFPEETLAYILDLCPSLAPTATSLTSNTKDSQSPTSPNSVNNEVNSTAATLEMTDFTTTLAIIQEASLASTNRWKGDTLRLDLLSLLLQDLVLLLASPQRCLRALEEIRLQVVSKISSLSGPSSKKKGPFSKTFLFRVVKKLEFYESFVQSPWFLGTTTNDTNRQKQSIQPALLDMVRVEVVMEGARVRQELHGWERDLEASEKIRREMKERESKDDNTMTSVSSKPLIQEL